MKKQNRWRMKQTLKSKKKTLVRVRETLHTFGKHVLLSFEPSERNAWYPRLNEETTCFPPHRCINVHVDLLIKHTQKMHIFNKKTNKKNKGNFTNAHDFKINNDKNSGGENGGDLRTSNHIIHICKNKCFLFTHTHTHTHTHT